MSLNYYSDKSEIPLDHFYKLFLADFESSPTFEWFSSFIIQDPDFSDTLTNQLMISIFDQDSEKPMGFILGTRRLWKKGTSEGWVKMLIVDPALSGDLKKGIIKTLITHLEHNFRKLGVKHLTFGSSSPMYYQPGLLKSLERRKHILQELGWVANTLRTNLTINLQEYQISKSNHSDHFDERVEIEKLTKEDMNNPNKELKKAELLSFIQEKFSISWAKEVEQMQIWNKEIGVVFYLRDNHTRAILGFIAIGATNPNWLGPMGVISSARRQGWGTRLLQAGLIYAKEHDKKHLEIPWVNSTNIKFYTKACGASLSHQYWKLEYSLQNE